MREKETFPVLCYDYKNGEINRNSTFLLSEFYDKTSNYYTTFTYVLGPVVKPISSKYIPTDSTFGQQTKLILQT